jgi:hypothetical protein
MRADAGRCGQMRADVGRCGQMRAEADEQKWANILGNQSVRENARMKIWARKCGLKNLGNRRHGHLRVHVTQLNDIQNNHTQHNNTELSATLRINDTQQCN